jgi:hypothetical protein
MAVETSGAETTTGEAPAAEGGVTNEMWRARIEACRKARDPNVTGIWRDNVAFRVQKPFAPDITNEDQDSPDQIAVPADWSRTRAKGAALFSQLPRVSLDATLKQYVSAVPQFEKIVNFYVPKAGAAAVMEECTMDAVNAAGHCGAMAVYEATFGEPVQVPTIAVNLPPPLIQAGIALKLIPTTTVRPPVSERFRWYRISPANLLRPVEFTGSDWQRAPWLGHEGTKPWPEAVRDFKLTESDKSECCQSGEGTVDTLAGQVNLNGEAVGEICKYQEIFYWGCGVVPGELRFEAIYRIVFVTGKEAPVIHEAYRGQRWNAEAREFVGVTRLPIEVGTLTYISDKAIPPSDSEIGRPMVLEQIRSRSQMILQRTRNLPVRTVDVNRVTPAVLDLLMRGMWQGFIPVSGPGDRAITQVASAAFPREDFSFDQVSNRDLDDAWSMSPNQMGSFSGGERSAREAGIIAGAYASVIGVQRAKMVKFFLGLVETTMGLLQLHLDRHEAEPIVGPDGVQKLDAWDRSKIAGKFVASVRQDATVLLDTDVRINQLMKYLNLVGKSGRVNIDPVIEEITALSGIDPADVMLPPRQPAPEPMNVSWRMSGTEDLTNTLAVAMLVKGGQAPSPDEINKALELQRQAGLLPMTPSPAPPVPGAPGALPALPPPPPPPPALPAGPPNPDQWQAMPRVTKRPDEIGG